MTFTKHGLHIPGTTIDPMWQPAALPCAGFEGCAICQHDAFVAQTTAATFVKKTTPPPKPTHMLTLNITVSNERDWGRTWRNFSDFVESMQLDDPCNISMTSIDLNLLDDEEEEKEECREEVLHYDEDTLAKVSHTLRNTLARHGVREFLPYNYSIGGLVRDLIAEMQNSGILFRERTPE